MMRKVKLVVTFLSLALLIGVGAIHVAANDGHAVTPLDSFPASGPVGEDQLTVGEVLAVGKRTEDGHCEMGPIEASTTAPGDGSTRWLAIRLDEQRCEAVVDAEWRGSLEKGPARIVGPLLRLLATASPPVPVRVEEGQSSTVPGGTAIQDVVFKNSEHQVYMYGYGGEADKLTRLQSWIKFMYDGSQAQINDEGGWCQGSKPFPWYEWVVDSCWGQVYEGPASRVYFEQHGDYHCDPRGTAPCNGSDPDGYDHTLHSLIDGKADGASHCYLDYSGEIVLNVDHTILQGCN